jgi:hypothetical protein
MGRLWTLGIRRRPGRGKSWLDEHWFAIHNLRCGVWGLALVFMLRAVGNLRTFGFFKTVTGTPFARWDTWLYSPLCPADCAVGRRVGTVTATH